jgi:hypothetical protein
MNKPQDMNSIADYLVYVRTQSSYAALELSGRIGLKLNKTNNKTNGTFLLEGG